MRTQDTIIAEAALLQLVQYALIGFGEYQGDSCLFGQLLHARETEHARGVKTGDTQEIKNDKVRLGPVPGLLCAGVTG